MATVIPSPPSREEEPSPIDFQQWSADEIVRQVRLKGYHEVAALTPEQVEEARVQARRAADNNGGEYIAIDGQHGLSGYLLSDLHRDAGLVELCSGIYEAIFDRTAPDKELKQLLRCLKGTSGQSESSYLHFDSYLVTVIIPLDIPDEGQTGDLILVRPRRPLHQPYLVNLIEKLVLDRRWAQRFLWFALDRNWLKSTRLRLRHGSIYIFFGYDTLHANKPCAPEALRATLVFHYGNPHQHNQSRAWISHLRRFRQ